MNNLTIDIRPPPLLDVIFHRFTPKKKVDIFRRGIACDYRTQYGARIGPDSLKFHSQYSHLHSLLPAIHTKIYFKGRK